jgi:zinc finger protein
MLRTVRLDVPYFGEIFETIFLCASCGFRHTDTLIPRISEPVEFVVHVEREADLSIRAVKSSSATVAVPELGLLWEPGPASIAQVTNVEGLLRHFDDAVARAIALFGTDDVRRKGERIRAALDDIIESRRSSDLVLKDPYGNSALIDPGGRVRRRTLEAAEASELMTGEYVFEVGQGGAVGLRPAPGPGPA